MGFDPRQEGSSLQHPSDRTPIETLVTKGTVPFSLTRKMGLSPKVYGAAAMCGVGWTWAVTLLATRQHLTGNYNVLAPAPPLWGNLGLPAPFLLLALGLGLIAAIACGYVVRTTGRFWAPPIRWLACSWLIPGVDLLRLLGIHVPTTFLEPLWLAAITGAAAGAMADVFDGATRRLPLHKGTVPFSSNENRDSPLIPWLAIVWFLAILCCGWWYYEGQQAYKNYLLGYNDFGHFGWRVVNTWEGRGFLTETPSLPAFWDHFNPGLALLAPLWGIWPDPRLFLLIQAICLAAPAPVVYGIARRMGASSAVAAVWAAAYLTYPIVGLLNLNYTYGWHPVSLALPLIFLTIWALLRKWRTLAFAVAILACSFQEDILAVLCFLAISYAFQAWLGRRCPQCGKGDSPIFVDTKMGTVPKLSSLGSSPFPADALPVWAWLLTAFVLGLAFVIVFEMAPFSKFQSSRFPDLGDSAKEILLSPMLRPKAFWAEISRPRCGYFLLCLMVPLGLQSLFRGWTVLLAAALPLGVLLAWTYPAATCIAFQYTTALIPIFFLAAMVGAARDCPNFRGHRPGTAAQRWSAMVDENGTVPFAARSSSEIAKSVTPSRSLRRAAVTALAAGATASVAFGALPWSGKTLTDVVLQTYGDPAVVQDRRVGSPANGFLNHVVARVGGRELAVLATGRIASHLLAVRRLDTVGQACSRWNAFQEEIGPGRSPIELFDWVVLDTKENFYQSFKETAFVIDAAELAHYHLVQSDHGILVYARPSVADSWHGNRGEKGDGPHLPERLEGCFAQMGTVPFGGKGTGTFFSPKGPKNESVPGL